MNVKPNARRTTHYVGPDRKPMIAWIAEVVTDGFRADVTGKPWPYKEQALAEAEQAVQTWNQWERVA